MAGNNKTVDEVLKTLTDDQKKAVSIFVAVAVEEELKKHGIETETNYLDEQE